MCVSTSRRATQACTAGPRGPEAYSLLACASALDQPFDPAAFGACVTAAPGYWMGFDATVRARSMSDTVRFLQENLKP